LRCRCRGPGGHSPIGSRARWAAHAVRRMPARRQASRRQGARRKARATGTRGKWSVSSAPLCREAAVRVPLQSVTRRQSGRFGSRPFDHDPESRALQRPLRGATGARSAQELAVSAGTVPASAAHQPLSLRANARLARPPASARN